MLRNRPPLAVRRTGLALVLFMVAARLTPDLCVADSREQSGAPSACVRPSPAIPQTQPPPPVAPAPPLPSSQGGLTLSGFLVGSYSYSSGVMIVPEAFGGASAPTDSGRSGARFDRLGLGLRRVLAGWLTVFAAIEAESHRERHAHLIAPTAAERFGCPAGTACERFGAEDTRVEVDLDRFAVSAVAPLGNGLTLSFGRFDAPFGIERHDETLDLTATTSEVFRFGRPQRMTGLQTSYSFSPWLDATAWLVNRWEAEETGEGDFNDNNGRKSVGARIGVSPVQGDQLLNLGLGAWRGVERESGDQPRSLLSADLTWSAGSRLVIAAEALWGSERIASLRQVGAPVVQPPEADQATRWWGHSVIVHYDFRPAFGVSARHALLDDRDRARTGVAQRLRSLTIAPVLHLSALIPELKPLTATVLRTAHPYHWVDLKLEYRLSQADRAVFGEAPPNVSLHDRGSRHSHQVQLQLAVNF